MMSELDPNQNPRSPRLCLH